MCAEAGANQRHFLGGRVVPRQVTASSLGRERHRRRMLRPLAAKRRVLARADPGGQPEASSSVEHRIVHVGLTVPDRFVAPIRRWRQWRASPRRVGITNGHLHPTGAVTFRDPALARSRRWLRARRRSDRWRWTVGFRLSVDTSSWRYAFGSAQSHWVMTTLRSTPRGRGGAGGTAPATIRSVQSANILSAARRTHPVQTAAHASASLA